MKHITCYLDFISPYAYLAFERLPHALQGLGYSVTYKPVLFAALLKHNGQLGPAEIAGKREWTYRQVAWLAREHGVALQMPSAHPFNPLALLRLALACGDGPAINRHVGEAVFRHVWQGGGDAEDAARVTELARRLQPRRSLDDPSLKTWLRQNTDEALALGLFGVPTFVVDGQVFWGFDALPVLRAWMQGDPWFASAAWTDAAQLPVAVQRQTR